MTCRTTVFAMVLLSFGASSVHAAAHHRSARAFLAADGKMRPELVAKTLASVEDEWKAQAALFADCNLTQGASLVNCKEAPGSFAKSCGTVVTAVVQGSSGDRDVAKEYMEAVCGQSVISGWHKLRCSNLAAAIDRAMTADDYSNRETLDSTHLCTGFWSTFLDEEQKRAAEEQAERAAQEKKAAEEAAAAAKKAEEEAKKKADAEAEEEKRRVEEQEKLEQEAEVKRSAEEAKKKAAEAAAQAAQKKAEAEAVAKAAQEKLAEAAKAEEEHKKLQEEHQKAVMRLKNATQDSGLAANATKAEDHSVAVANVTAAANVSKEAANVTAPAKANSTVTEKKNASKA